LFGLVFFCFCWFEKKRANEILQHKKKFEKNGFLPLKENNVGEVKNAKHNKHKQLFLISNSNF